jgi:excisionase family DNA binding protein
MGNEADAGYQPDALLTGAEVARIFRVSAKTVGRWGRSGLLPLYRTPGGDHRYRLADVTTFLDQQKRASDA